MFITNAQWAVVVPFVKPLKRMETRGRPRQDDRRILEGILWVLRTGSQWKYLPKEYPPYQTCHRRFQTWVRSGTFDRILEALAMDMEERGRIKLNTCFLDGTFASAKKGGLVLDPQSVGKAPKSWLLRTKGLFQSPSVWRLLLRTKSPWLKRRLPKNLSARIQIASSLIVHTTLIRSMPFS